jgi:hypothetical protein
MNHALSMLGVSAGVAFFAGAAAGQVVTHEFTFDGVPAGTPVNTLVQPRRLGAVFHNAYFGPRFNQQGFPIPGPERWRIDRSAPDVLVDDPSLFGRGPAPSPENALEALLQPVLITFRTPLTLEPSGLSLILDNDTFGFNGLLPGYEDVAVHLFDASAQLIERIGVDQTTPGFQVSTGGQVGVKWMLLPAGAFYDNLHISATPVPAPGAVSVLLGAAAVALPRRRSRR